MIQTTTLTVAGMECGTCVRQVTRALEGLTGVTDVRVSLRDRQVTVEHLPEWVESSGLAASLRDAGYRARATRHDIYTGGDVARSAG